MAATAQNTHRLLSALNTVNATVINPAMTTLYAINGVNGAAISYLKIYDVATTPDQTLTPRHTEQLAANSRFQIDFSNPLLLGKGLAYRITAAAADADTTIVAAAAITCMNVDWS